MTKIMTSSYVQSALQTLLFSNENLDKTQQITGSGLKIGKAADNAGYWSTAKNLTSEGNVLSSVGDALSLGASKVDTTYEGVASAIDILDKITTELITGYEESTDRNTINGSIAALKKNLASVAQAASFSGDNWLLNTTPQLPDSKSIPFSYKKGADGAVSLQYLSIKTSDTVLIDSSDPSRGLFTKATDADTLNPNGSGTPREYYLMSPDGATPPGGQEIAISSSTTKEELDDMVAVVGELSAKLKGLGSSLGTMSNRIDQQQSFVGALGDSLNKSVSRLVDADMEEESTKLAAYKSQRDLAVEVVSMANSFRKSLASLFQG